MLASVIIKQISRNNLKMLNEFYGLIYLEDFYKMVKLGTALTFCK